MRREVITPRPTWQQDVEAIGFNFHTIDGRPYWREDACYVFDSRAIDEIELATGELHALCLEAVDRIVRAGRYADLGLDDRAMQLIERKRSHRDLACYRRAGLSFGGHSPRGILERHGYISGSHGEPYRDGIHLGFADVSRHVPVKRQANTEPADAGTSRRGR